MGANAAAAGLPTLLAAALLLSSAFFPSASAASSFPARIAGRIVSTTASAVARQLWSLKSAATKTDNRRGLSRVGADYSSLACSVFLTRFAVSGFRWCRQRRGRRRRRRGGPWCGTREGTRWTRCSTAASWGSSRTPSRSPLPATCSCSTPSTATFTGSSCRCRHIAGQSFLLVLQKVYLVMWMEGCDKRGHPKGFTVDDRGNIHVADALNMAIRKISDTWVTTIAGGKSIRGHIDGPSDDAKFSTDFEIRYISSSCSLMVIDRGNQAIREIPLHDDDCVYQYEAGFPLGISLLFAAGFFGYMLALLQRRVLGMASTADEPQIPPRPSIASIPPYQKPLNPYVRPPQIPREDEATKQETEEGFFTSVGKLIGGAKSSMAEIFGSRKKRLNNQYRHQQRRANPWPVQDRASPWPVQDRASPWPVQDSYAIPHDETPPPLDTRAPTPQKNYAFMPKEHEKIHHARHGHPYFNGWDDHHHHPQQRQPEQQLYHQRQHLQQHRQFSTGPQTFYEQSCEAKNEIVFGAVQEVDSKRRMVEIKAVNYGDTFYEQYGMRYRNNYIGYNSNTY